MAAAISARSAHGTMREMSKQVKGQISIFEYLSTLPKDCTFSGHTCNKKNLWDVAHTLDDVSCPETCCRNCKEFLCGARCNGAETKIYPVEIKGLMDDAYCPKCGYCFWETKEMDCETCPSCGIRVSWEPWHRANDEG